MKKLFLFFACSLIVLVIQKAFGQNVFPTPSGNVGIGTTAPQTKLQITEAIAGLTPNGSTVNNGFMITGNSTGGSLNMGIDGNGTFSPSFYSWIQSRHRDAPNYYNLALNPIGGNVGIGTATPLTKLQVMDGSGGGPPSTAFPNQGLLISGNSTGGSLNLGIDATSIFYSWIQSRNRDNNSTYSLALNPSGGSVGIGTTTPIAKLHVEGNTYVGTNQIQFLGASNGLNWIQSFGGSVFGNWQFKSSFDNIVLDAGFDAGNLRKIVFKVGGSDKMILIENGNVGIGTTAPDSKLAVNGIIHAKEVRVDLTGWPDYVFEPTYHLKPLAEIETYIKENKHLPEVPSAKEMEKNGVQLGEMNMLLLKKVEELTLWVIELKKENAEQIAKYEEQQKEIEMLKRKIKQ
jgi:hypothetical protein